MSSLTFQLKGSGQLKQGNIRYFFLGPTGKDFLDKDNIFKYSLCYRSFLRKYLGHDRHPLLVLESNEFFLSSLKKQKRCIVFR